MHPDEADDPTTHADPGEEPHHHHEPALLASISSLTATSWPMPETVSAVLLNTRLKSRRLSGSVMIAHRMRDGASPALIGVNKRTCRTTLRVTPCMVSSPVMSPACAPVCFTAWLLKMISGKRFASKNSGLNR